MDINYDYYRIFYYVAKYGSFSRAAEVLLKGQPNLTKIIHKLEVQLGCRLLVRSNRGVTLTPEGEKLYHYAEIAFENLSFAQREIVSKRNLEGGSIFVATTEIALYGALLPALTAFHRDYPSVKIRLANLNSTQALDAVKKGIADFAAATLYEKEEDMFRITRIRDFKEILCCKKGYQYDPEHIFSSPYISINRGSYTYQFYRQYLLSMGIEKEPDIEVATADQILPLVKSGIGIGFICEFLAADALESGGIEEITLPVLPKPRSICLAEDKAKSLSIAARELKRYLCRQALLAAP